MAFATAELVLSASKVMASWVPPLHDQTKMGPGSFAKGGTGSEPRDEGAPRPCPLWAEVSPAAASHRGPEGYNCIVSTLSRIPTAQKLDTHGIGEQGTGRFDGRG